MEGEYNIINKKYVNLQIMAGFYQLPTISLNDTSNVFSIQFKNGDEVGIDLTDAIIRMQIRKTCKTGNIVEDFTLGAGITMVDVLTGQISIDSYTADWGPGTYFWDIQITFITGSIKTYIEGQLKVVQDVTN